MANLVDVLPEDHEKGSVVWLRRRADGTYEPRTLAAGLPRVADVEAADFDGDGDLDLVVAAFGWRTVGAVCLLEPDEGLGTAGVRPARSGPPVRLDPRADRGPER